MSCFNVKRASRSDEAPGTPVLYVLQVFLGTPCLKSDCLGRWRHRSGQTWPVGRYALRPQDIVAIQTAGLGSETISVLFLMLDTPYFG